MEFRISVCMDQNGSSYVSFKHNFTSQVQVSFLCRNSNLPVRDKIKNKGEKYTNKNNITYHFKSLKYL